MTDASREWIAPLLARYARVVAGGGDAARALVGRLETLRLADALVAKDALSTRAPAHPVQIALLGPTQSGKSTLVNLLVDAEVAGVSALAGHTVHAGGFAAGVEEAALAPLDAVMAPLERAARSTLERETLDAYSLERIAPGPRALVESAVVWDTPDFDSIEAGGYRSAVLRGAALADAHVLALSKDKYGDRRVWDMLALLHGLGRPLLVCLNKLDAGDEATVLGAFRARFVERFGAEPALVPLPFLRGAGEAAVPPFADATRERLGAALAALGDGIDRSAQRAATTAFVARHRAAWLAPLAAERAAARVWREVVAETLAEAEKEYVARYLDDPRRYDSFNRALAELLALLELPGVAGALARTREIVTWPARTLLGLGRARLGVAPARAPDAEAEVLELVLERALARLGTALGERAEETPANVPGADAAGQRAWWRALERAFRGERAALVARFGRRAAELREAFAPRIEAAARRLHERLERQPALLNTLRAARATTDAAGVALAVKSGGLAPADLVLAPAMLSVTTLLTESALGRYLDTVRRELQAEQRTAFRRELLEGVLGETLARLARELDGEGLLGGELEAGLVREVEKEAGRGWSDP